MAKFDPDVSFTEPNGRTPVVQETRVGPPLSLVGQNMRRSLVYSHLACIAISAYIPDDLPQPKGWKAGGMSLKHDGLMAPIRCAFQHQLTAFLALYNMLGLNNWRTLADRCLAMTSCQFAAWLDRIAKVGSIKG